MHSADWKSEERNVRSKAPWWTAGTVTFSGGGETAEETSREIRFGRNIQLPGSHWAFVYSAPGPHLHRDYCNFPLWKSKTKAPLPPSVTQILFWNAIKIFFVQAPLLGHTVYHVHSIYSWAFRGRRHMLRHPERWRLKSFKKKDGQTQKMHHTCYADSPKYKRKSRCERKQWVFSVPFILCCPSGFLLRGPLIIYKDGAFQGEHAASYIIHREREAAAACSKRKQSETVRTPENLVHSHQPEQWWWMKESEWHICNLPVAQKLKKTSSLIWNQTAFLIILTVIMRGCIFSSSQPFTADWEVVPGRC